MYNGVLVRVRVNLLYDKREPSNSGKKKKQEEKEKREEGREMFGKRRDSLVAKILTLFNSMIFFYHIFSHWQYFVGE